MKVDPAHGEPSGFEYAVRKNDDVVLRHHGRDAGTLCGRAAAVFLAKVTPENAQELMARATGNYRHGNERQATNHERNR